MTSLGGPTYPVTVDDTAVQTGGPAIPVAVVAGAPLVGGPARPVYVVTSGPVASGPAIPVALAPSGTPTAGGPAVPVYVVSGDLTPTYIERVQALRPIIYLPLSDLSGTTAADASGNGRNGAYNGGAGITLGQPGIGDGLTAAAFSGADTCVGIGGASFGAAWNGNKGSMIAWARIDQASRWTDGLVGWWFHVRASDDVNYNCVMGKLTSNTLQWRRRSGVGSPITSVSKVVSAPTGWLFMAMTWDLAVPEIRAYDQTGLVGAAATGFTTWAKGTHVPDSPNISVLFAGSLTLQEWFGRGAHCAAFDYVLSASEIASLATV